MMALFRENAKTLTHCRENYIMQNAMIYIVNTVFCVLICRVLHYERCPFGLWLGIS